jgi:hypothetical protein
LSVTRLRRASADSQNLAIASLIELTRLWMVDIELRAGLRGSRVQSFRRDYAHPLLPPMPGAPCRKKSFAKHLAKLRALFHADHSFERLESYGATGVQSHDERAIGIIDQPCLAMELDSHSGAMSPHCQLLLTTRLVRGRGWR